MIDLTETWNNILRYNYISYEDESKIALRSLTNDEILCTGSKPSELLDKYFLEQVENAKNFVKAER